MTYSTVLLLLCEQGFSLNNLSNRLTIFHPYFGFFVLCLGVVRAPHNGLGSGPVLTQCYFRKFYILVVGSKVKVPLCMNRYPLTKFFFFFSSNSVNCPFILSVPCKFILLNVGRG